MITHGASECESVTLYTVLLNAGNGLSRLTKLTTSKGAGTADSIRKFSTNPFRIEWDGRFELESNLEASQVPT